MKDGAIVAKFLNLAATEPLLQPNCRAVEQVVVDLTALTEEASRAIAKRTSRALTEAERVEAIRRSNARMRQVEQFNALLRPYTWQVELVGWDKKGIPIFGDAPTTADGGEMFILIRLARAQLLDRLRKCAKCSVWFFARKPWAEYCSRACWKVHYRSIPEVQEQHRKDQRKHYQQKESKYQEHYKKGLSPADVRELKRKRKNRVEEKQHGKRR